MSSPTCSFVIIAGIFTSSFLSVGVSLARRQRSLLSQATPKWTGIQLDGSKSSFARYNDALVLCLADDTPLSTETNANITDGVVSPSRALIYFEFRTHLSTAILFYSDDEERVSADGADDEYRPDIATPGSRMSENRGTRRHPSANSLHRFIVVRLVRGEVQLLYDISTESFDRSGTHRAATVDGISAIDDSNTDEINTESISENFETRSHAQWAKVGEGLNDGRWHSVLIRAVDHGRRLSLSVDGVSEPSQPPSFGSGSTSPTADEDSPLLSSVVLGDDVNDDVVTARGGKHETNVKLVGGTFIGGLPTAMRRQPARLTLPQAAFERHFRGSVRRFCVSQNCEYNDDNNRDDAVFVMPTLPAVPIQVELHQSSASRTPCHSGHFIDATELRGGNRMSAVGSTRKVTDWEGLELPPHNADVENDDDDDEKEVDGTEDSMEVDRCAGSNDPCRNGGVCVNPMNGDANEDRETQRVTTKSVMKDPVCECDRTDFDGTQCDVARSRYLTLTLNGNEYIECRLMPNPIIGNSDIVDLSFKTNQPSAVIFFAGTSKNYLSISLVDGCLIVRTRLESGSFEAEVKPPQSNVRFDDGQWHRVIVIREAREVTIQVDRLVKHSGTVVGDFTTLSSSALFVGGIPPTDHVNISATENFQGCLRQVSFQSDGVYLDLIDLVRQDTGFVRVRGGPIAFDRCSDLETSHPISLSTEDASLELQFPILRSDWSDARVSSVGFVISSIPAIELTLVTNEPSGLILHSFLTDDLFVALELFDGEVNLLVFQPTSKASFCRTKVSGIRVDDSKTHRLSLKPGTGESITGGIDITASVDDWPTKKCSISTVIVARKWPRPEHGKLVLGRLTDEDRSNISWYLTPNGFIGCIQNVRIDNRSVNVISALRDQEAVGVMGYCRYRSADYLQPPPTGSITATVGLPVDAAYRPRCASSPCLNGGQCRERWTRFVCDCAGTGHRGLVCMTPSRTLSFNGTQYFRYTTPDGAALSRHGTSFDASFRFRTAQANCHLLSLLPTRSGTLTVRLVLGNGRLQLTSNYAGKMYPPVKSKRQQTRTISPIRLNFVMVVGTLAARAISRANLDCHGLAHALLHAYIETSDGPVVESIERMRQACSASKYSRFQVTCQPL